MYLSPLMEPGNTKGAGERLGRLDQQAEAFVESTDSPIETLIVMGASAGGFDALEDVVRGLSRDLPAAVVILLHSGRRTESLFANALSRCTDLPVVPIQNGGRLQRGRIFVSPPGYGVFLKERTLCLEPTIPVHPVSTINRLFESAAKAYHDRVIGVILSGYLRDGTAGLKAVHEAGGLTMVQDPAEAQIPDMPKNAMRDLPVTFCLRLAEIGPALDLLARRGTIFESGLATSVRILKERVALFRRLIEQSTRNVDTREFLVAQLATLQGDLRTTQKLLDETLAVEPNNG